MPLAGEGKRFSKREEKMNNAALHSRRPRTSTPFSLSLASETNQPWPLSRSRFVSGRSPAPRFGSSSTAPLTRVSLSLKNTTAIPPHTGDVDNGVFVKGVARRSPICRPRSPRCGPRRCSFMPQARFFVVACCLRAHAGGERGTRNVGFVANSDLLLDVVVRRCRRRRRRFDRRQRYREKLAAADFLPLDLSLSLFPSPCLHLPPRHPKPARRRLRIPRHQAGPRQPARDRRPRPRDLRRRHRDRVQRRRGRRAGRVRAPDGAAFQGLLARHGQAQPGDVQALRRRREALRDQVRGGEILLALVPPPGGGGGVGGKKKPD